MSVIWRAFDQSLQRMVAIKVMDGSLDEDHPGRELIRREARATARLIHPDAIEVYDYGETVTHGGRLAAYVVMRLLEGRSLADRIAEGPLPWEEAVAITAGLARVLAAAHDKGIVHRDVTPENVLLAEDGPKLLDFGIAAFIGETDDQLVADFGTPPYVAPERLHGTTADPAVDVYALGVLLFEMLTGRLPYPERTWEAIEAARREGPPPTPEGVPGLPSEVAELCRRCLSADPAQRPCARTVAEALTRKDPPPQPRGLRGAGWGAGAAAVGVMALLGVLWYYQPGALGTDRSSAVVGVGPTTSAPPIGSSTSATGEPAPTSASALPVVETVANPEAKEPDKPDPDADRRTDHNIGPREPARPIGRTPHPGQAEGEIKKHEVKPLPLATKAGPIAVDEAVRRFNLLVDGAEATRDIDQDVALDLKQVLHGAIANGAGLDDVRSKIATRFREGRLPPVLKQHLEAALDKVKAALAQASGI